MWLLDANMFVHLPETLGTLGVSCETAANRGWQAHQQAFLGAWAVKPIEPVAGRLILWP
jgi:hypothetical protein